jgi:hypothetical protein
MKYLLLICSDGIPTQEKAAAMQAHLAAWDEEMERRGVLLGGAPLHPPGTAKIVRVRAGKTLVTDGPFAETKEYVAGIDLLDCESLEEALEIAAKMPVSWFHAVEVRRFWDGDERLAPVHMAARASGSGTPMPMRYLLTMYLDGIPLQPQAQAAMERDGEAWRAEAESAGMQVFGNALQPPDAAKTVRVRGGKTLITDGPFTETKEFVGGVDVLSCESFEQAVALAAKNPVARLQSIEVRQFMEDE